MAVVPAWTHAPRRLCSFQAPGRVTSAHVPEPLETGGTHPAAPLQLAEHDPGEAVTRAAPALDHPLSGTITRPWRSAYTTSLFFFFILGHIAMARFYFEKQRLMA